MLGVPKLNIRVPGRPLPIVPSHRSDCPDAGRSLAPSPARDVPRIDPATVEIERLAQFIAEADGYGASVWPALSEHTRGSYRDMARHMVRYFDELEEILAEILTKGGRF